MSRRRPALTLGSAFFAAVGLGLVLPVIGIGSLRIFDTALARQTEAELIGQASVIASLQADALRRDLDPSRRALYGRPLPTSAGEGIGGGFRPRVPAVDLVRQPSLPPAAEARKGPAPEPAAAAAGARLSPILKETQRGTLAGMRVVDSRGVVVASSREELGLSLAAREEVAAALDGRSLTVLRRREPDNTGGPLARGGDLRVFVGLPVLLDGRIAGAVIVSRTPVSLAEWASSHAGTLLGLVLIVLATGGALGFYFALAIRRPLVELTARAAAAAADGDVTVRALDRPMTAEIAALSEAVAVMSERQAERARYIRDFATLVSHEFKTPLAGLAGALELLSDEAMVPADRARFLANADSDVARLSLLTSRLLELARADMSRRQPEATDLAALLAGRAESWRARGLPVALDVPETAVTGVGAAVLEPVIDTLLDNALRHGGPAVHAGIIASAEGGGWMIRIADSGPGISEANAARLFQPFFTTGRAGGGTGLGLAIARSLLRAQGATLAWRNGAFEMVLPGAAGA